MRRLSLASLITLGTVGAAAIFIFLQLQPGLLFADTTPAGGDMGAHVWGPAYLRDHVLPKGRITGWTPDWYAGFPAYHFYFPLPNLLIVVLDIALPYGVAFKLVTVSGLVALPVAAWAFGCLTKLPFPVPALLAVSAVPFVFDRFHTIWGGNAAATLAGEFAFSIALAIALVFLGALYRAIDTGAGGGVAAILFAATALCHLLPAAFAVLGAVVILLARLPDRRRWRLMITIGLVGFALAAFWFVPFIVRHQQGFTNDMGWERTQDYAKNLLPWLRTDDQAPTAATRHYKVTIPLAIVGFGFAIARRRRAAVVLGVITAACAVAFVVIPHGAIWNARFLPFYYLATYLMAAYAVGEGCLFAGELMIDSFRPDPALGPAGEVLDPTGAGGLGPDPALDPPPAIPNVPALAAPVVMMVAVLVAVGLPLGVFSTGKLELPGNIDLPFIKRVSNESNFVPAWAKWNYSGYERKPDYAEYREVVQTMARLGRDNGCGRAMWEYEPELNRYGTPMALMLLPHWTDGCIGSMEGLFFESTPSVPYHFLNQSELSNTPSRAMRDLPYRNLDVNSGVQHLQLMGVRYYMALTPEAQSQAANNPDLHLLATTKTVNVTYGAESKPRFWQIYEVRNAPIVAPLDHRPAVVEQGAGGQDAWLDLAVPWYQDVSRWDVPLASDGPADWPRIATASEAIAAPAPHEEVREARVSDIVVEDDRISFKVDRPGVPVMVRMSYFPNWKARGAEGPWRVTPNFMVVIPTDDEVTLRYGWTFVDVAGWLLTIAGAVVAVAMIRAGPVSLPARSRRQRRADIDSDAPAWTDPFTPSVFAGTATTDDDAGDYEPNGVEREDPATVPRPTAGPPNPFHPPK